MPAAGEIHRLKKRRLPAGFLAGDESVKHNGQFNSSLSRLNLIFSQQPNFLATTLVLGWVWAGTVGAKSSFTLSKDLSLQTGQVASQYK